jgi:hypothetical protein
MELFAELYIKKYIGYWWIAVDYYRVRQKELSDLGGA